MNPKPPITLALASNDLLIYPPEGSTPEDLQRELRATGWRGRTCRMRGASACGLCHRLPGGVRRFADALSFEPQFDPRPALEGAVTVALAAPAVDPVGGQTGLGGCRAPGRGRAAYRRGQDSGWLAGYRGANTKTLVCVPTLDLLGQWRAFAAL